MNLARTLLSLAALTLGGCDLLFPEDPRLGTENEAACAARVRASLTPQERGLLESAQGRFVPSYTYDVTLLELAALQALMVPGTDETAGARLMRRTNETSTAVRQFMDMPVTAQGAFFLGRSPALYRVRGEAQAAPDIIASGCARQQANMRLIAISWSNQPAALPEPDATDSTPSNETDP